MDIRKIVVGLSGALLLASGDVSAQSGIEVTSTNPFEKQLLVEFENGTVAIADDNTQHIYLATNSGQEFEI
ncbi:hypothetical protein [Lysobacter sp. D1-1-M9]|uniref:hypothetical protein n=1 Tax=Novilysobacter longmucuonensis TaxID=3098603 RepID=UPI002FC88B5B